MTEQRVILMMGQGVDAKGQNPTQAACRAVQDALSGSSLPFLDLLDAKPENLRVLVTLAVPKAVVIDQQTVAAQVPYASTELRIVPGGLSMPLDHDTALLIAVSIEIFLPHQQGWELLA